VVEDCVNAVGVDVNTASAPLLARVSGISSGLADGIVAHRDSTGPFRSRRQLTTVPRLGPKAFEQSAGFLRITGGDDPLDASSVHPEAYPVVRRILTAADTPLPGLIGNSALLHTLKPAAFADDQFGVPTVTDILRELEKPGRDPRPAFRTAAFAEGVETLADLTPGLVLEGTVTNVAAFGAFVDIGVHQDGLVHVSAMSRNFVSDPREVAKPGDVVRVKVLSVDIPRQRISLTLRLDEETETVRPAHRNSNNHSSKAGTPGSPDRGGSRGAQPRDRRGAQSRDGRGSQPRDGRRPSAAPPANGAMADALRRAGLTGGDGSSDRNQRRRPR
jgi:uncharacterized protein